MTQTATALIAALVLLGGAAQHPNLSGRWVLNRGQSENPRGMMQGRDSGGGESGGG